MYRKMTTLLIALVLVVSCTAPAFAATGEDAGAAEMPGTPGEAAPEPGQGSTSGASGTDTQTGGTDGAGGADGTPGTSGTPGANAPVDGTSGASGTPGTAPEGETGTEEPDPSETGGGAGSDPAAPPDPSVPDMRADTDGDGLISEAEQAAWDARIAQEEAERAAAEQAAAEEAARKEAAEKKAAKERAAKEKAVKFRNGLASYMRSRNHDMGRIWSRNLAQLFIDAGEKYDLDPKVLMAIAQRESGFRSKAVSTYGYKGLMQTSDFLARTYGYKPSSVLKPEVSIDIAAHYLSALKRSFKTYTKALSGYVYGGVAVKNGRYSTAAAKSMLRIRDGITDYLEKWDFV